MAPCWPTCPLACTRTMRAASPNSARLAASSSSEARRASDAASSCSRVRISRARRSCSPRAAASVRLARAARRHDVRELATSGGERFQRRSSGRRRPWRSRAAPRRLRSSSFASVSPTRSYCAAACCVAWRSAVAEFALLNTSVRAASTSRFESFDLLLGPGVLLGGRDANRFRLVARASPPRARPAAATRARGAPVRAAHSSAAISSSISEARAASDAGLLAVELQLLLAAVDGELAGVRPFANRDARDSASACSMRRRPRSASTSARCAAAAVSRSRARRAARGRPRWPRPARDSGARTAPSPSGAVPRADAGTGAPWPPAASACRAAFRPRTRCRRCG